jgi:hypothetical protein
LAFLRGDPGWFDLYKAFEVMDVDVQHRCEQGWQRAAIGWPSKTAIKRFTQSAQPHRHSRPAVRQTPKGGWMPLDEAKPFVARFFSPGPTGALRNLHQPATAPPNLS